MGAFIAQQPNGLYCRFSTIVDTVTHYNMTREEYLNNITDTTKNRADAEDTLVNYLQPFSEVVKRFIPNNMSQEKFNELVKIMSG
ncbi:MULTISPECIES: hypothetical protein [unclassified Lysinibacillus]|uniref:hypothetical protein n=1 Tax=unclassified Lysinibacillus TaxID=2636778 RepID=UPI0038219A42